MTRFPHMIARVVKGCVRRLPLLRKPPPTVNKVHRKDCDQINELIRTLDSPALIRLIERRVALTPTVLVLGDGWHAEQIAEVLRVTGRIAHRVQEIPDYTHWQCVPDILHAGSPFAPKTYDEVAFLREHYVDTRVFTLFQLLGPACLFQAIDGLIGYHVQPREKLLSFLTGEKVMGPITRLNEHFPLQGKRVIEFGPLDGAMSSCLLEQGVGSLTCVELRIANVLKILAAREYLGWRNLSLVIDDMHVVDGKTHGRFDLVVAHGVYYHSQTPFRFLRNLTTLSDSIWLGGFCANPARLREPLVPLEYEGHIYQAQPYRENRETAGAGVHPVGYYFLPEDLLALFTRWGYAVTYQELEETPANKNAGHYFRALLQRPGSISQTGAAGSSSACDGTASQSHTEARHDGTNER